MQFKYIFCRLALFWEIVFTILTSVFFFAVFTRRSQNVSKLQDRRRVRKKASRILEGRRTVLCQVLDQPESSPTPVERFEFPALLLHPVAHPLSVPPVVSQV